MMPIVGILRGWLIGGEQPAARMFLACGFIVSSVFFVAWKKHNR